MVVDNLATLGHFKPVFRTHPYQHVPKQEQQRRLTSSAIGGTSFEQLRVTKQLTLQPAVPDFLRFNKFVCSSNSDDIIIQ